MGSLVTDFDSFIAVSLSWSLSLHFDFCGHVVPCPDVWFRRRPYSTHFQYAVHRAEFVGAALRAAVVFVRAARLAAPLAIHDELEFMVSVRKCQRGLPVAVRLSAQRRCHGTPVVERAGYEHGLRVGRMAGEFDWVLIGLFY